MGIREKVLERVRRTALGNRLVTDKRYQSIAKAVVSLTLNLLYAFYNGILGAMSASLIFITSAVYYLLLSVMRSAAVLLSRKENRESERTAATCIGTLLVILSGFFPVIVLLSMKHQTAAVYGTIPMITIATYTFLKITTAVMTVLRHRGDSSSLFKTINAVRYAEVAVSLLTMQQSMLASFGEAGDTGAVILNACTGAGVCAFLFALGVMTIRNGRKEKEYGKIENCEGK